MTVGRLHHVVLDCRHPSVVARFWSSLLGLPVTYESDDWVVVAADDRTSGLAFQLAPDHEPPRWPDARFPQQVHFDVMCDDLDSAEEAALALGASRLETSPADGRVFADPAGHPFCLIPRPAWAPPVQDG